MKLTTKFELPEVQFDKATETYLLVSATAPKIEMSQRNPINLLLALDNSGSMQGDCLDYAKKSAMKLVEHLQPGDRIGMLTFDSNIQEVFQPTTITAGNKEDLKARILKIQALGSTNLSGGMSAAFEWAKGETRVLVLSDGFPNVGIHDLEGLTQLTSKRPDGVTVSTFGYGPGHNSKILEAIASTGQGNYTYIKNPDDVLGAIGRELGGLLSCYGQNLKFTIQPREHLQIVEVLSDVDVEQTDKAVHISIPDIYGEETRHLLLKVKVGPVPQAFPRETTVVDVIMGFVNAKTGEKEIRDTTAKITFGKAQFTGTVDQELIDQIALYKMNTAQKEAEKFARAGNYAGARSVMDSSIQWMGEQNISEHILNHAETTATYFASANAHAASQHDLVANAASFKKGRWSGSGANDAYGNETSGKLGMMRSFQSESVSVGTPTPAATVADKEVKKESEKSLTKKRSSTQW